MILTQMRFRRPVVCDSQITHTTVLTAVGVHDHGRVLWASPRRDMLIIQSGQAVPADAITGVVEARSGPVRTRWQAGDKVRLSLIANPVKSEWHPPHRGMRRPLPIDECDGWLRRKLAAAVDVGTVEVEEVGRRHGRRRDARHVTHRLVGFHALGVVLDPDELEQLILSGVGPGKAYGAGLLLVGAA